MLSAILVCAVLAQAGPPQRERNLADFDFAVQRLPLNYAGYPTKVTSANRAELEALGQQQRAAAGDAKDDAALVQAVSTYLGFFKDHHLSINVADVQIHPSQPRVDAGALAALGPR